MEALLFRAADFARFLFAAFTAGFAFFVFFFFFAEFFFATG
jgi:hypothetical protein